ncbi:MAG: polysaccharide deacetylase family protein, partial [Clostridia bacterium]|nr:polysaccharide deacetylase family protein [Clostridia bacterium]
MSLSTVAINNNHYSWYCQRNKLHMQPTIDTEMAFIEDHNCFYVDKRAEKENKKIVYLTFDAGYENGNVNKILDILKEEKVNGSFFILENMLAKHSELVCRMLNDG